MTIQRIKEEIEEAAITKAKSAWYVQWLHAKNTLELLEFQTHLDYRLNRASLTKKQRKMWRTLATELYKGTLTPGGMLGKIASATGIDF